jgi:hypothetical protein
MELHLTDEETRTLRDLLHDYLPALRLEVARTDAKDFRHLLIQRQDLAERLLADLSSAGA